MLKSLLGRYASSGLSSALANRSQHRRIPVSMCRSSAEGLQIKQAGSTGITNVLVAVDPDTRGAIACATWTADPGSSSPVELSSLSIKVFDMPCATVHLMKKMKATGKPAVRRYMQCHGSLLIPACLPLSPSAAQSVHYITGPYIRGRIHVPPLPYSGRWTFRQPGT